jgi:hypothetical protein
MNQAKFQNRVIALSDISVSIGNYTNMFKRATDKVSTTELQGATFPFKASLYFGQANVEVLLSKPGNYRIEVVLLPQD